VGKERWGEEKEGGKTEERRERREGRGEREERKERRERLLNPVQMNVGGIQALKTSHLATPSS
jgi:hypothetical protein